MDWQPGLSSATSPFTARLVTGAPTPYVLVADTLEQLRAQLPRGLAHSERQPADPPDPVEIWFVD